MREGKNNYEPYFLKLFIHKEEGISSSIKKIIFLPRNLYRLSLSYALILATIKM